MDESEADDIELPLSLELIAPEDIAPEDIEAEDIAVCAACFFFGLAVAM